MSKTSLSLLLYRCKCRRRYRLSCDGTLNLEDREMQFARLSTMARGALVSCALLLSQSPAAFAQSKHTLPLFVSASHTTLQSFVRVINRSDTAGDVTIYAYDDDGERHGPVTLSLDAHATQHFNSDSLRDGDVSKGLAGAIGNNGTVHLRLELETELDIEPLAYARPKGQGFLTSTHDIVENHFDPMSGTCPSSIRAAKPPSRAGCA